MYLDTLESQLKQMIKKSRAERVARKVQKKNSGMEEFLQLKEYVISRRKDF